ncbi:MAG: hypothetical protein NZZ41_01755 [Candidatus Dojkabacteria bacterium]|nr:hypothetical protein [Candidatus Dojkabacteria bacterium]
MKNTEQEIKEAIKKIEIEKVNSISDDNIKEIFSLLKSIDKDLEILLDILLDSILEITDSKLKTLYTIKVLKFYGIQNNDILSIRTKYFLENNLLVKRPFLKPKQKEMLQVLLNQLNFRVF